MVLSLLSYLQDRVIAILGEQRTLLVIAFAETEAGRHFDDYAAVWKCCSSAETNISNTCFDVETALIMTTR